MKVQTLFLQKRKSGDFGFAGTEQKIVKNKCRLCSVMFLSFPEEEVVWIELRRAKAAACPRLIIRIDQPGADTDLNTTEHVLIQI